MEYHAEVLEQSTCRARSAPAGRRLRASPRRGRLPAAPGGVPQLAARGRGRGRRSPVSLVGGVLVALVSGRELSLGRMLGLLAVFGLADPVHGAACVAGCRRRRTSRHRRGRTRDSCVRSHVVRAARQRLSPTVATTARRGAARAAVRRPRRAAGTGDRCARWPWSSLGGLVTTALVAAVRPAGACRWSPAARGPIRPTTRTTTRRSANGLDRRARRSGCPATRRRTPRCAARRRGRDPGTAPGPARWSPLAARGLPAWSGCAAARGRGRGATSPPSVRGGARGPTSARHLHRRSAQRRSASTTEIAPAGGEPHGRGLRRADLRRAGQVLGLHGQPQLTYQRAAVVVDRIEDGKVLITSGSPSGTEVVTTGAAEVYGDRADTAI